MCLASVKRKLWWRTPSYPCHVKVKICQDPLLTVNMLKLVSLTVMGNPCKQLDPSLNALGTLKSS